MTRALKYDNSSCAAAVAQLQTAPSLIHRHQPGGQPGTTCACEATASPLEPGSFGEPQRQGMSRRGRRFPLCPGPWTPVVPQGLGVKAAVPGVTRSRTCILRGEEHRSQHLLGVCLSFIPVPALAPPSSFIPPSVWA